MAIKHSDFPGMRMRQQQKTATAHNPSPTVLGIEEKRLDSNPVMMTTAKAMRYTSRLRFISEVRTRVDACI